MIALLKSGQMAVLQVCCWRFLHVIFRKRELAPFETLALPLWDVLKICITLNFNVLQAWTSGEDKP
ncbi:hypothetical protein MASR1M60_33890 [Rhodocyclaceae bacterium]